METQVHQIIFDKATDRKCGSCTACCTWLGIAELKKYTGDKCKHLRSPAYAHKRCGIYSHKPVACSEYLCMWRIGWGKDEWQPNKSGILITPYPNLDDPMQISMTITVFDIEKATADIDEIVNQTLLLTGVTEVRVISHKLKKAFLYRDGNIYSCQLMPQDGYESLTFLANDEPVGHYQVTRVAK